MSKKLESTSKFLSFVLRHKPETIGLTIDSEGWVEIDQLIRLVNGHGTSVLMKRYSGKGKGEFLKAFWADIFFDDQQKHCESARQHVATGHVPHGVANE